MKSRFIYGFFAVLILIGAVALTRYMVASKKMPSKDAGLRSVIYVKTGKVKIDDVETNMVYSGRVSAYDNVSLSAEVGGKILQGEVRFKEGESFKKGDVIIRIYSDDVKATLKANKSSFLQTLSLVLPDIKVDYPDEYDKWMSFFNAIDVEKPLPDLPKINSNKEKVFLAANDVLSGYYELQEQEIVLSRYIVTAPFDGCFTSVSKEIGSVATTGTELASIIRTDRLEVVVPVFPSDLAWIKIGDKVELEDNGNTFEATVARLSNFVDESTQSVNVYLTYTGKDLLEGEYVNAKFLSETVQGYKIPREAVLDDNSVYKLEGTSLTSVKVNVVCQMADYTIIDGLEDGTEVVVESLTTVNPEIDYKAR
ncbi:MAG: efflux RND transporter periplasmic adaptor subunit [Mangrovibacterium sp.]